MTPQQLKEQEIEKFIKDFDEKWPSVRSYTAGQMEEHLAKKIKSHDLRLEQAIREEERSKLLQSLPEERIIHGYIEKQDEGKSTEYCDGWNEYRNKVLQTLK